MTAPYVVNSEELAASAANARFTWEYDQDIVNVESMGDPPNSRKPMIHIRRRMVSEWEYWNPESEQ